MTRKNLSLGKKITFAAILPLLAACSLAAWSIFVDAKNLAAADSVERNVLLVESASRLVHELQKERGLSIIFLNGGNEMSALQSQSKEVDKAVDAFQVQLAKAHINKTKARDAQRALESLHDVRLSVNEKRQAPPQVFAAFSETIASCMGLMKEAAAIQDVAGLRSRMLSLYVLETAKEDAGRLRGAVAGILAADQPLSDDQIEAILSYKSGVEKNLDSPAAVLTSGASAKISEFKRSTHWTSISSTVRNVLKRAERGHYQIDGKTYFATVTESIDQLHTLIDAELRAVVGEIQVAKADLMASVYREVAFIIGLIVAICVILFVVIRGITAPISRTIENLGHSSHEVTGASTMLHATSQQISSSSSQAAASLEETVASIEELSSMVKQNAEHAREAAALAQSGRDSAERGEAEIKQLITSMLEIANGSKKIEEIINVIDDIAFQTNLLALNAAVEAARAGEQGRGFAVVAEAVRSLAQRSGDAAKNISSLIKESVSRTEHGSTIAEKSGAALGEIVHSAKKVADLNQEIAHASQEQATGLQQISHAMNQLDQATQSNASSSEEAATTAQQMAGQAATLTEIVQSLSDLVGVDTEASGGLISKRARGADPTKSSSGDLVSPSKSA